MRLSIRVLLLGVFLVVVLCSGAMSSQTDPATTAKEKVLPEEKVLPQDPSKSTAIPGEYLVLFKARESILQFEGAARSGAVAMMLEMQAEHLATKYGVTVESTYSAISESSGKGMLFIRSEKAAKDPEFHKKLLEDMRADPLIEGVSPNEVQRAISAPKATS